VARYGKEYKDRVVARLLPPESAPVERVSAEVGVSTSTLERWLADALKSASGGEPRRVWPEHVRQDAQASEIDLQIVKLPEARKGFVLLPRRWVVERSFGWLSRFRRLSRDFERLPQVLASLHFVVFAILMLPKAAAVLAAAGSS